MNKKIIFGFLLILLISFTFAETQSTHLTINQTKYEPFPAINGEYLDVWINILNNGSGTAKNVVCELKEEFPIYLQKDENSIKIIGNLSPSMDSVLHYKLIIDNDALKEDKILDFKCKFGDSTTWFSKNITISINPENPAFAIGQIVTDPEKLNSDSEDNKIQIELQNIGNQSAQLVTTKLILPQGFNSSQSYSDTANLGNIESNNSKTATYYLDIDKNLQENKYPAKLIVNYKSTNNNNEEYKQKIIDFDLDIKAQPKFEITKIDITPNSLRQGDNAEIKLTIKNIGTKKAEEVSLKVYKQSDQPFDFDKKYDYIGNLDVGQEGEVILTFTIDSTAELKEYLLSTEIRYLTNNEIKTTEDQIKINVELKNNKNQIILIAIVALAILIGIGYFIWKKKMK